MNFYNKYIKYKNKYTRLLQTYTDNSIGDVGTVKSIGCVGGGVGCMDSSVEGISGMGDGFENIGCGIGDGCMDGGVGCMDGGVGCMDGGAGKGCVIKGSGVIIVSIINDTPCILLPREKNKSYAMRDNLNNNFNLHEDIGGGIHHSNLTVEENTIFELYEETAGYIICNPNKLKKKIVDVDHNKYDSHIDLEFRKGSIYRCYIIGINGKQININQMNSNLNILTKNKKVIDKPFFECDNWTWFPIKNFKNNFYDTYIIVNDILNNPKFISSRTWKILLQSYNKQGIKGIDLCYKIIKNIKNFNKLKLYNKNDHATILPLLQVPITSFYL